MGYFKHVTNNKFQKCINQSYFGMYFVFSRRHKNICVCENNMKSFYKIISIIEKKIVLHSIQIIFIIQINHYFYIITIEVRSVNI